MQTILVTGSNGQLGSELKELSARHPEFNWVFLSRAELAINNEEAVDAAVAAHRPRFIVNCAAYTAVDKAETNQAEAMAINGTAVGFLAAAARKHNSGFIHISTDYVFNGSSEHPWVEDDATGPINQYGATKLEGERLALEANPETIIIRTSWVYSRYGANFVKTMLRLMKERTELNVVSDQWGSPTYAADLASAIVHIIQQPWQAGIYHFSNTGITNWALFAAEISHLSGSHCKVNAISSAEYPTPAARPAYSVLNTAKISTTFGVTTRQWQEALQDCLQPAVSDSER